ncbi:MAG TPA: hypothetical protein VML54_08955, partial [Candidatus Limnocylindrales bacterium]|nr:hypothetical protein [Candidatus Limnocylindrales bacterium]
NDKRIHILSGVALVAILVCLYGFSRDDVVIALWVPLGLLATATAYCFWPRAAGSAPQKKNP